MAPGVHHEPGFAPRLEVKIGFCARATVDGHIGLHRREREESRGSGERVWTEWTVTGTVESVGKFGGTVARVGGKSIEGKGASLEEAADSFLDREARLRAEVRSFREREEGIGSDRAGRKPTEKPGDADASLRPEPTITD